ncbi:MAG: response regulator [Armatimonadetes bacterium]|nr:response regulator [Armatimonadota bacterium]
MEKPIRILIVDDEASTTSMIERKLKAHLPGLETRIAQSGRECLEALDSFAPDLLLLDYAMPELDGLEVLREMRARKNPTPVIFITGYGSEKVAAHALRLGAHLYIQKVDLVHVLEAVVDRTLEQQQLIQQNQETGANRAQRDEPRLRKLQVENRLLQMVHSDHDIRNTFSDLLRELFPLAPLDCMSLGLVTHDASVYRIHVVSQSVESGRGRIFREGGSPEGSQTEKCPLATEGQEFSMDSIAPTEDQKAQHGGSFIMSVISSNTPFIDNSIDYSRGGSAPASISSFLGFLQRKSIRSYAILPFLDGSGKPLGSLNAASRETGFFTEDRTRLLIALASHVGLSLLNQRRALLEGVNQTVCTLQHVANNALAAIVGNAELILCNNSGEVPDRVHTIVDASMRISGCLNELMKIKDPLLQKTTFGGVEFFDVRPYLTGKS